MIDDLRNGNNNEINKDEITHIYPNVLQIFKADHQQKQIYHRRDRSISVN